MISAFPRYPSLLPSRHPKKAIDNARCLKNPISARRHTATKMRRLHPRQPGARRRGYTTLLSRASQRQTSKSLQSIYIPWLLVRFLIYCPGRSHVFCSFGVALVEFDKGAERRLRLKIDYMIVPIVSLLYLFCFIDRINAGMGPSIPAPRPREGEGGAERHAPGMLMTNT